ncbi:MAG: hypothetical protein EON60_06505 [Alphaproteobacteria bacterium]|nr:MAG: hypothetical protein EON60_06505 [Alphaproteobacteria bacterium]
MLQIHHAAEGPTPSKAYADACWQANPRISPDWWREAQGYTVGRIAHDWRSRVPAAPNLTIGSNLILAALATLQQALQARVALATPQAAPIVLVTPDVHAPAEGASVILFNPQHVPPADAHASLVHLEQQARSGTIDIYGLSFDTLPQPSLNAWLDAAALAAEEVWGRKKRPALRMLHLPLCLTNLAALTVQQEVHKAEPVSVMELAARLGFAVIATPQVLPGNADPSSAALATLTAAAHAEHALNQTLGGWPQAEGQQLFSLLAHLAAGLAPWPTPQHWYNWQAQVLPHLVQVWQALYPTESAAYLQALQALRPFGESLAAAAAQPILDQVLEVLTPRLNQPWQGFAPTERMLAILASIPAVTTVAVPGACDINTLQAVADIPDIGAVLLG